MSIMFSSIDFQNLQNYKVDLYGYSYDSPIEQILGELLAKHITGPHVVVIPQVEILTSGGNFILDFLLVINDRKYAIECDGKEFHEYYHDLYRDAMLLCEDKINEMVRFRGTDLTRIPSACALFLGKLIPNLFDQLHMKALDMRSRNERWEITRLQDPEGEKFNDEIFSDDIMDIQDEKHFWGIGMEVVCRNDRLIEYNSYGRVPDWINAYSFAKKKSINTWKEFVDKYSTRFDEECNLSKNENLDSSCCDDVDIPF